MLDKSKCTNLAIYLWRIRKLNVSVRWKKHPDDQVVRVIELTSDQVVFPGFIDIHIHGANGYDVMDGTMEALDEMTAVLPQEGTTSFLATTITESKEATDQALQNVARFVDTDYTGAEILGIHLEGPLSMKKEREHSPSNIFYDLI